MNDRVLLRDRATELLREAIARFPQAVTAGHAAEARATQDALHGVLGGPSSTAPWKGVSVGQILECPRPAEMVDAAGVSHQDLNELLGAPGDQVATPAVETLLAGCLG